MSESKVIMYTTHSESDGQDYEYLAIGNKIVVVGPPVKDKRYRVDKTHPNYYRERILEFIGVATPAIDYDMNSIEISRNRFRPTFTEVGSLKDVDIRKIARLKANLGDRLFISSPPLHEEPAWHINQGVWFLPETVRGVKVCNLEAIANFDEKNYFK